MIIQTPVSSNSLGAFVKAVVDIEKDILSIDCELHIDCADELLTSGSRSENLWGANIYPEDKKIDFVSLINIRPSAGNRSMEIENPEIRKKVETIIARLVY